MAVFDIFPFLNMAFIYGYKNMGTSQKLFQLKIEIFRYQLDN